MHQSVKLTDAISPAWGADDLPSYPSPHLQFNLHQKYSFAKILQNETITDTVKLTDAIWLLQLVISFPLIRALGDPSQAPIRIWTKVPSMRGRWLTELSLPPFTIQSAAKIFIHKHFAKWNYYWYSTNHWVNLGQHSANIMQHFA